MFGVKVLEERNSKYNGHIRVARSLGLGIYIQAEGLTQSGGIVESIWRSTIKKVKSERQEVKKVLILGLGGGTAAKLIRKYWPEAKIAGVDIDPVMVELGQKYLGLKEVGVKIRISDAYDFDSTGYDLVIVDLYNGDEFPKKFEDEKFLKRLTKNSTVIFNRLYFGDKRPEAVKFGRKLEKIFTSVEWFYPEANLMFVCHT